MTDLLRRRPEDFLWATGIEDTFVPQTRPGHRALDEYQLMGHYEHWRQDLALVRDLGLKMVRWGVPWYRLEPFQPGEFDWRWTDQVIPYMVH
jgi:beta-glucosidase